MKATYKHWTSHTWVKPGQTVPCARSEINQSALMGMVGGGRGEGGMGHCRPRMGRKALILRTRHLGHEDREVSAGKLPTLVSCNRHGTSQGTSDISLGYKRGVGVRLIFIKSQPLNTDLLIFFVRNCRTYNACTLQNQVRWLFQGDWIVGSTSYFFCCCCLKEHILDKSWLFRLRHLAGIFFQMSKVSCHLKENGWKYSWLELQEELEGGQ